MAEVFVATKATRKFICGDAYTDLTVVNIVAPGGARMCAYSCNMNIDADGVPQAYGSQFDKSLKPLDYLENAGWRSTTKNAELKAAYDKAKKAYEDLEKQKIDLATKAKPGSDPARPSTLGAAPPLSVSSIALDKQIAAARQAMIDHGVGWDGDPKNPKPKNYGKIFWKWYGVVSLTPEDAGKQLYLENLGTKTDKRRPNIKPSHDVYEDVFGAYPVYQSKYEPGPDYFVTPIPGSRNTKFKSWDQRYYLPPDQTTQIPYAALADGLAKDTGLQLKDTLLAIRLDSGTSLAVPFLDSGYGAKVGECSTGTFTGVGGVLAERISASKNDFLLLYLGFPKSAGQSVDAILAKLAATANAEDLPVLLSFIADTTAAAKSASKTSTVKVTGDPLAAFKKWKASSSAPLPSSFDVINQALSQAGFSPFAQRMLKRHGTAIGGEGPWLTAPVQP